MAIERFLRPDEVALVLRRAAELDALGGGPGGALDAFEGVAEAAVLAAAEEAGFSPDAVCTALAELRAGALGGDSAGGSRGPGWLADQLVVEGAGAVVARAVEHVLERERFRVRRRDGERLTWMRRPRSWSDDLRQVLEEVREATELAGVGSWGLRVRRFLGRPGAAPGDGASSGAEPLGLRRGPDLSALSEVVITLAAVPGRQATLVRAEADGGADRYQAPAAAALGGGIGLSGGAALAVAADPLWLAASVPVAGVLALWRYRDSRQQAARRRSEVADALSRLLDAVDRRAVTST